MFSAGKNQLCVATNGKCCIPSSVQSPAKKEFLLSLQQEDITVGFYASSGTEGIAAACSVLH